MRSAIWRVLWLGLASVLVVGGCPGGTVTPDGVAPGMYTGTLACSMGGQFSDGSFLTTQSFPLDMKIGVAEDGALSVDDVTYGPGALRVLSENNNVILETISSVFADSDGIYVSGQATMTLPLYTVTGPETLIIAVDLPGSVAVSYSMQLFSADLAAWHWCEGTLMQ